MARQSNKYEAEDILVAFYNDLMATVGNSAAIDKVHIPLSDVFYVREALHHAHGKRYNLAYVEWCMMKEGHISPADCYDGNTRMQWTEYQGKKEA